MATVGTPNRRHRDMTAITITLDQDLIRLRALLERLDPRDTQPCPVEGCTHLHPLEMHEREAA
jgi:hypothetical protein